MLTLVYLQAVHPRISMWFESQIPKMTFGGPSLAKRVPIISPYRKRYGKVLKEVSVKRLNGKIYVVDAYAGANEDTRLSVRFIMEVAWQAILLKICLFGLPMRNSKTLPPTLLCLLHPKPPIHTGRNKT